MPFLTARRQIGMLSNMIISNSQFGDLGWGWRSIGRAFKKVASKTYNVAKMPVAMAKRVASASASVLCDQNGNPRSNDSTSVNYCRAVKLKQEASMRKYLPGAASLASKVTAARKVYNQVRAPLPPPPPPPANDEAFAGFGAYDPWATTDDNRRYEDSSARGQAARMAYYRKHKDEMSYNNVFSPVQLDGVDLGADLNLLASLAGADMNELAFALADVTPTDIGGVTTSDAVMFAPALIAVAAGFWMAFKD